MSEGAGEEQMRRVLLLARRGAGFVSPNPMVGAVVVKGGLRVGEGYHLYTKKDHAEVIALRRAGPKAFGADLYVNLEPCSHYGRTPPCVDRILESGIRRVFVATLDPNPQVSGAGVRYLREHGVFVEVGLCEEQALRLNEVFFHFITKARPFVTLKLAMTLDGKIATQKGDSKWITGEQARQKVHRLRFESDAIMVGVRTILSDDPSLDVRWRKCSAITKVILDTRLSTPPRARVFNSLDRVLIFHGPGASGNRSELEARNTELVPVPTCEEGLVLDAVFEELARLSISSVVIEGGSKVAASALRGGHVNKVVLFYGPKFIGGNGLPSIGDLGVEDLQESLSIRDVRLRRLGESFFVEGYL